LIGTGVVKVINPAAFVVLMKTDLCYSVIVANCDVCQGQRNHALTIGEISIYQRY
jgi:hypothetical protein